MTALGENPARPARGRRLRERLGDVDRRVIFLAVGLAVALPLIFPLRLPVAVSREARAYYDALEQLRPGDEILVSFDYEPETMAELDPMSLATLRHAFRKDLRVIALTNYPGAPGIAQRILGAAAAEAHKEYGVDYVFLGYNPDYSATMLRMGESIRQTFPTDHFGTPADSLPLLRQANSYADTELLVAISSTVMAEYWIIFAGGTFKEKVISANTAIQAVLIYPYFQTGQLSGFLGGLKGAAEYEKLIGREGDGLRGMDAQSMAHLLIVCFIVLGNIGFLLGRRERGREGPGRGPAQATGA